MSNGCIASQDGGSSAPERMPSRSQEDAEPTPATAVVIGTFNRREKLRQCLESLRRGKETEFNIIAIDAGSTDGTLEYLRQLSDVHLVEDGARMGQAAALNRVSRKLGCKYVCWLSDDNELKVDVLREAVRILDNDSKIGMVGLKVRDVEGPFAQEPYIGGIWPSGVLNVNQGIIRRRIFEQVGYFDEEFRDYGIDADLTTKVLLAGYKVVYTKKVAVLHYRDHGVTPGAIEQSERAKRMEIARDLYCRRYQTLLPPTVELCGGFLRVGLWAGGFVARLLGNRRPNWLAALLRDWHNAVHGRFISKFDMITNFGRAYHLVQDMKLGK